MTTLLHLDSSPRQDAVSRQVTAAFAGAWREANPAGTYLYRDLAAQPVPHIDEAQIAVTNRLEAEGQRDLAAARDAAVSPEEKASWGITWPLVEELLAADTIVIGAPMYNFSVPSTFKAWFDRVIVPPLVADFATGEGVLAGKQVVVATARGGSYKPGTPRESFDHQEPYLRAALSMIALHTDLTFLHSEMTKSAHVPRLASFQEIATLSLKESLDSARELARR